jgi:hypothetical protein
MAGYCAALFFALMAGMDKASQHSGDENLQADFERGKRMRRLARVMNTRLAAKVGPHDMSSLATFHCHMN